MTISATRGGVVLAILALFACGNEPPRNRAGAGIERARSLEGRLVAPCCWTQTLDVHESEIAASLRAEIRERLGRGETSEAIEDDLAARYGERIRAVPKGKDPRGIVPGVVAIAMAATLIGLALLVRRWSRRGRNLSTGATSGRHVGATPASKNEYDQRIEDELVRLDEP